MLRRWIRVFLANGLLGNLSPSTTVVAFEPDAPAACVGPSSYTAPTINGTTVVGVATQAEFESRLSGARGVVTDIVFTGATYDRGSSYTIPTTWHSARFWSQTVGSATFRYQWVIGGNGSPSNGEIHGVRWAVNASTKASSVGGFQSTLALWGRAAQGYTVEDCVFSSNITDSNGVVIDVIQCGIGMTASLNYHPSDGTSISRCEFVDLERNGILLAGTGLLPIASRLQITDVCIDRVFLLGASRGTGSGTGGAETGIFTAEASFDLLRAEVNDCGWAGVVIGGEANGGSITDLRVDYCGGTAQDIRYRNLGGVGLYFEEAHDWTVTRAYFGPRMTFGINMEWPGSTPAAPRNYNITIRDADFECYKAGILMQYEVDNIDIDRCRFRRCWRAGIQSEPTASNITIGTLMNYDLEPGAEYSGYVSDLAHGGSLNPPPEGWRLHPDIYESTAEPQDRVSAEFHGESSSGDWATLATDLVTGGAGNFTVVNSHMYLQSSSWNLTGGKTVALLCEMGNDESGWLWRQRGTAGTRQGIRLNPVGGPASGLTMFVGGSGTNWTPSNWPTTWGKDRCLIVWRVLDSGRESVVHFVNLTEDTSDRYHYIHSPISSASTDTLIIGASEAAGSVDEFTGIVRAVTFYSAALTAGQIAEDYRNDLVYLSNYLEEDYAVSNLTTGWSTADDTINGVAESFVWNGREVAGTVDRGGTGYAYRHDRERSASFYKTIRGPFDVRFRLSARNTADNGFVPLTNDRLVAVCVDDPANVPGSDVNGLHIAIGSESGVWRYEWQTTDDDGATASTTSAAGVATGGTVEQKDLRIVRRGTDRDVFDLYYRASTVGDIEDDVGWNLLQTIDRSSNTTPGRSANGAAANLAVVLPDSVRVGLTLFSDQTVHDVRLECTEAYIKDTTA